MTQDEIIRMARDTGKTKWFGTHPDGTNDFLGVEFTPEQLERFAVLVAAHEREKQAEQEPVHIENIYKRGDKYFAWIGDDYVKIYAAPVQQVDLTDDEIAKALGFNIMLMTAKELKNARAVIAADREKNK